MSATTVHKPVRLGLIGAGVFARDAHVPSLLRLGDLFQIVAVYSRTQATADQLLQLLPAPADVYTDVSGLLARDDIEAVIIALPIPVMPDYIEQALAAGKHVLSEKPIAPDVATAHRLIQTHHNYASQVWMVGENWRYEAAFLLAAEMVRNGEIGRPVTCHWTVYAPFTASSKYYHTAWRRSSSFPGGLILDGGVHHVAILRLIMGEIAEVSALLARVNPDLLPADTLSATLRFGNGAVGAYIASYAAGAPWPPYLYVVGERGSLRVQRREVEITKEGVTRQLSCEGFDGVQKELAAFAHAIRHAQSHANTPEQALQDLAVMEAMLRSAESGRPVNTAAILHRCW